MIVGKLIFMAQDLFALIALILIYVIFAIKKMSTIQNIIL